MIYKELLVKPSPPEYYDEAIIIFVPEYTYVAPKGCVFSYNGKEYVIVTELRTIEV